MNDTDSSRSVFKLQVFAYRSRYYLDQEILQKWIQRLVQIFLRFEICVTDKIGFCVSRLYLSVIAEGVLMTYLRNVWE